MCSVFIFSVIAKYSVHENRNLDRLKWILKFINWFFVRFCLNFLSLSLCGLFAHDSGVGVCYLNTLVPFHFVRFNIFASFCWCCTNVLDKINKHLKMKRTKQNWIERKKKPVIQNQKCPVNNNKKYDIGVLQYHSVSIVLPGEVVVCENHIKFL